MHKGVTLSSGSTVSSKCGKSDKTESEVCIQGTRTSSDFVKHICKVLKRSTKNIRGGAHISYPLSIKYTQVGSI